MATFTIVDKIPNGIAPTAYVIENPNFIDEIKACDHKKPRNGLASVNYLRELVIAVGKRYYGANDFDVFKVPVSRYKGIPVSSTEEVHNALVNMVSKVYPDLIDRYVDKHIVERPPGTQLIYFLGELKDSQQFTYHGIVEVTPKDAYKEIKKSTAFKKPSTTKNKDRDLILPAHLADKD